MNRIAIQKRYGKMLIFSVICFALGYSMNIELKYEPNLNLTFQEVFVNNFWVNYKAVFWGILTGGIYSFYYIAREIFWLGAIIKGIAIQKSLLYALTFIGCHGIFEIPTIVLSGMIGVNFAQGILGAIKKQQNVKSVFRLTFILAFILLGLLVLSAVVETQITTYVIRMTIM